MSIVIVLVCGAGWPVTHWSRQTERWPISVILMEKYGVPPAAEVLKLLSPRAKQVIVLAGEEMKSQGEKSIRPTHLFLGLMNEGEGLGAGLLRSLGVSLLQARTALTPPVANQICSFCGRSGSQVARFFPAEIGVAESSTTSPGAFICDHCVRRFSTMLGSA